MRRASWVLAAVAIAGVVLAYLRCRGGSSAPHDAAITIRKESRARLLLRELQKRPPAALSGHVFIATAPTPAPNALVCVEPVRERDVELARRCAATRVDGAYDFVALPPGEYVVWASLAGHRGVRWRGDKGQEILTIKSGASTTDIDLVLLAGGDEITGTVRDTRGTPIEGALVHAKLSGDDGLVPVFTAQSDARGAFRIVTPDARTAMSAFQLVATAAGFVDASKSTASPASGIDLVMVRGAKISGTVVEVDTRTPVSDARVSIGGDTATTDGDGRFELTGLAPGRYKPLVRAIGKYGEAAESVVVGVGASVDNLVIEIHPVAVVAGRIALPDTKPCPADAGEVALVRRGSPDYFFAKTIGDGDVVLEGVVPGTYAVSVHCKGYMPLVAYEDLVVANSDVEDLVWPVAAGARLIGRVRRKDGWPLPEVRVNYHVEGTDSRGGVVTAADGTFAASGLSPGRVTVTAFVDKAANVEAVTSIPASLTTVQVDLVAEPYATGTIAGTLVDAGGKPVPNGYVHLVPLDDGREGNARTSGDGSFIFDELPLGGYEVRAVTEWVHDDHGAGPKTAVDGIHAVKAKVTANATARVRVVAVIDGGAITGSVVDASGKPLPDVAIDVARADPEPRNRYYHRALAWSGIDGGFRVDKLPTGKLAVRARIEGANEVAIDDVSPGQHVRLVLQATGSIVGIVVDPNGAPADDVMLEVRDRTQDVARTERLFHTRGKFAFRELPAGTYRLVVDDDRQTAVTVALDGNETSYVRLVTRQRYAIRGRLVGSDGKPLAGWSLEIPHQESSEASTETRKVITWTVAQTTTNARGEFLAQGLSGNEVTISAADRARDPEAPMLEIKTVPLVGISPIDIGDVVVPKP